MVGQIGSRHIFAFRFVIIIFVRAVVHRCHNLSCTVYRVCPEQIHLSVTGHLDIVLHGVVALCSNPCLGNHRFGFHALRRCFGRFVAALVKHICLAVVLENIIRSAAIGNLCKLIVCNQVTHIKVFDRAMLGKLRFRAAAACCLCFAEEQIGRIIRACKFWRCVCSAFRCNADDMRKAVLTEVVYLHKHIAVVHGIEISVPVKRPRIERKSVEAY